MKAIIINIGDELLIGQVTNFNASWMAEQFNKIGIEVCRINVISDTGKEILNALKDAEKISELIILTGGLGPTNDDITKETLCKYFNTPLVFDKNTFNDIEGFFKHRGWAVSELNRKQAEVPKGCKVIRNTEGTAPGLWLERRNKIFIATPGVPFEMKAMMSDHIIPMLNKKLKGDTIVHKTVLTQGVGESLLAEMIAGWENALPENIRLAYLPSPGLVKLRLTVRGKEKNKLQRSINEEIRKLKKIISGKIFGYDDDTLEKIIGRLLKEKKKTLVTAESCTGGAIAQRITTIAGSSAYFKGSVVAYSNEIKENILEVKHKTLFKYGAVSEETVKEMAMNARQIFCVDYSVAVSGISGPEGGTKEKPVGLVWIAVASLKTCKVYKFQFGNNRLVNIERAVVTALNLLRKMILEE
jgi:nicotinamide-nucleotide amidase